MYNKKRFILIPTGVIKFLPAFTKGKGREFLALISMLARGVGAFFDNFTM